MVEKLNEALIGVNWEVIFVDDDSADGSVELIRELAQKNPEIRLIHRIGRRGLASACIEGMLSSTARFVAVMDADLQHDERLLPNMLSELQSDEALDLVNASRYTAQPSTDGLSQNRANMSRLATWLAQWVLATELTDPMSGFFMLRRSTIDDSARHLYGQGFKILLDICSSSQRALRVLELPYTMRSRQHGDSKLDSHVILEFFILLVAKFIGRFLPARLVMFGLVGLSGVAINLGTLGALHRLLDFEYIHAQSLAIALAMTTNYLLNNRYTFTTQRLHGVRLFTGLLSFYLTCSIGALIGIAVGDWLFELAFPWWSAGIASVVISAFWNYSTSSIFVWGNLGNSNKP